MEPIRLDPIERAIADLAAGRAIVVADDENRENEGDLIIAAEHATPELLGLLVRYTSGYLCAPAAPEVLDRLALRLMVSQNADALRTAYTVSVDASSGVTTGISAADRARTARVLADPDSTPDDLIQPGHLLPLRARTGGVLERAGHTEAAVDLARLAGLAPVGVIGEMVHDDGTLMRLPALRKFADEHDLALVCIADLVAYRRTYENHVARVTTTRLPTPYGEFTAYGFRDETDGSEHLALVYGDLGDGTEVLTRVHSECLTGDVFGSQRCDCGPQLQLSLQTIADQGAGVVVYLRGHEGRGIGLAAKLQAYALQDRGRDTVDANLDLGYAADERDYAAGVQILRDLGVRSVRLLTNNPQKVDAVERYGLQVSDRIALAVRPTAENLRYLSTKVTRMGHLLDLGQGERVVP